MVKLPRATLLVGALILVLAGCASGGAGTESDEPTQHEQSTQPEQSDSDGSDSKNEAGNASVTTEQFAAAFEAEGFTCVEGDNDRNGLAELVVCDGDQRLRISIRKFDDVAARDTQLSRIQDSACKIEETTGQEIQRVTTSQEWIVMPGGGREVDLATFDKVMTPLGLGWTDYTC